MSINSKQKGKRGELEAVRFLRAMGYEVHRTAQYCGNVEEGAADVVGLPGIHIEVKRNERLNVYDAVAQAKRDAQKTDKALPIALHRKNNMPWLVTMYAEDWMVLYREYESGLWLTEKPRRAEKKKGTSDLSCGEK